jgi:two-component system response regulator AtoC
MLEILLVEDEPDLRSSLGQVLRDEGHDVELVGDGAAALDRLSKRPFHLVVSDVRVPGVDGLSLLHRVRAEFPATEVVLMTAYGSLGDAAKAVRDDAVQYLTKPFDVSDFVSLISEIDRQRRARGAHAAAKRAAPKRAPG